MNDFSGIQNQQKSYLVSYPRSGKTWLAYCCEIILGAKKDLIYTSHWLDAHAGHEHLSLSANYNNVSVLLLRNYKDAIFSNMLNDYKIDPDEAAYILIGALTMNGCSNKSASPNTQGALVAFHNISRKTRIVVEDFFHNLKINHQVDDFLLDGYPRLGDEQRDSEDNRYQRYTSIKKEAIIVQKEPKNIFSSLFCSSFVFHYYFALQMQRYYDLLNYYDKKKKAMPKETLLIRYETFIDDPHATLNNLIDLWSETSLISSKGVQESRRNLQELMTNFEFHKQNSIAAYKGAGHMAPTQSPQLKKLLLDTRSTHFLTKVDDVFRNVDLELFNKYLVDYGENK